MDKKKVIENLKQVELYINKLQGLDYTQLQLLKSAIFRLHDAQDELKKPDWISVEDELPPYGENVLVTDKEFPNFLWFSHREDEKSHRKQDKNGFPLWKFNYPYHEVTHWRKIDKLEV